MHAINVLMSSCRRRHSLHLIYCSNCCCPSELYSCPARPCDMIPSLLLCYIYNIQSLLHAASAPPTRHTRGFRKTHPTTYVRVIPKQTNKATLGRAQTQMIHVIDRYYYAIIVNVTLFTGTLTNKKNKNGYKTNG